MEIVQKYFADFSDEQTRQLAALKELYTEWNEKINVISRKDMDNFYTHHVLHSMAIAAKFNFEKKWIFIRFIGTHTEYDKINANLV